MTPLHSAPRGALLLARLIPAEDRAAIVGDLLEDAHDRALSGAQLTCWLWLECGAVAAGLSAERARGALTLPPLREMAVGVVLEGTHALRGIARAPWIALLRLAMFCASAATLGAAAEVLVSALFSAAGLGIPNP
jgi:hypothetical protein